MLNYHYNISFYVIIFFSFVFFAAHSGIHAMVEVFIIHVPRIQAATKSAVHR